MKCIIHYTVYYKFYVHCIENPYILTSLSRFSFLQINANKQYLLYIVQYVYNSIQYTYNTCMCVLWFYSKSKLNVSSARPLAVECSDTMVTWIDEQMKHWLMFSFQHIAASVSCWDVFQATFLHMLTYISLQKNINETRMERVWKWIFVSCGNLLSV